MLAAIKSKQRQLIIVGIICFLSISFRLLIASMGLNFDMESWHIAATIVRSGHSVYAHTERYNYGPLWAYIVTGLSFISGLQNQLSFHFTIAAFLSIVDCLISFMLWKMFGKTPALIYLINPVSALLTGFHSQFDNLAVLIGLVSWYFYINSKSNRRNYYLSAVLLGLSLITKHILIFFPIWISFREMWSKDRRSVYEQAAYHVIAYGLFALSFGVELLLHHPEQQEIIKGIVLNVFGYSSRDGHSALMTIISTIKYSDLYSIFNLLFPFKNFGELFGFLPLLKGDKQVFFIILTIYGFLIRNKNVDKKYVYPLYLLVFFAASPALADQYFAIPLVFVAIFYNRLESIIFTFATAVFLLTGNSYNLAIVPNLPSYFAIGKAIFPIFPWSLPIKLDDLIPQAYMLLFSVTILYTLLKHNKFIETTTGKARLYIYLGVALFFDLSILFMYNLKTAYADSQPVEVMSATFGVNCDTYNNVTDEVARRCNGLKNCNILVDFADKSVGCKKSFIVTWTCSPSFIKPVYYGFLAPEAFGKQILISCSQ